MTASDLLFELGTEELPPHHLPELRDGLKAGLSRLLDAHELSYEAITAYATPRRIAVLVQALAAHQKDRFIERKGPKSQAAFDRDGNPTKACFGFARACGTTVDQLAIKTLGQEDRLYYAYTEPGQPTESLLPQLLKQTIQALPITKSMRWSAYEQPFIRPVHWVTALYGSHLIPVTILNCQAQATTYGHRFHCPEAIELKVPADYPQTLKAQGKVLVDIDQRQSSIQSQIQACLQSDEQAVIDSELLQEVSGLVEWPVALRGTFDPRFLKVPDEALISAIENHQKCFPIKSASGQLKPSFITIANIESHRPDQVIAGNERVVQARLADAEFFYEQDLTNTLAHRVDDLKHVLFQRQLGSLYDKTQRVKALATQISEWLGADTETASRTALLAKTDLITEMVQEFPELQGVMGYYYALTEGESQAVAQAISEHYYPRFSGDRLPSTLPGAITSLADRLDTLVGIFGIQHYPTSDKDPFALRRAGLGILRILIEQGHALGLEALIQAALNQYGPELLDSGTAPNVKTFLMERLKAWYLDQGVPARVFSAVAAVHPDEPFDVQKRLQALQQFLSLPEAESLISANKRVTNLLKKQGDRALDAVDRALLLEPAELDLMRAIQTLQPRITEHCQSGHYTEALNALAQLRPQVDRFFDEVRVITDDTHQTANRLGLLKHLRGLFAQVADIALI